MLDLIPIVTSDDATPLEMKLARVMRDNLQRKHLETALQHHQGQVNLLSTAASFNLSIACFPEKIIIRRGLHDNAKVSISGDLALLGTPGIPLKVTGRWQYPRFAAFIKQLVIQDLRPWSDAAKEFFEYVHDHVDVDISANVQSNSEAMRFEYGSGNEPITIKGSSSSLQRLFDKQSILIEEVVRGRIQCQSSLRTTALLSELTVNRFLGEL